MKVIKRWIVSWLWEELSEMVDEVARHTIADSDLAQGYEVAELEAEIEQVRTDAQSGFDRIEGNIR